MMVITFNVLRIGGSRASNVSSLEASTFYLTGPTLFCGLAILFVFVGLIVMIVDRGQNRPG